MHDFFCDIEVFKMSFLTESQSFSYAYLIFLMFHTNGLFQTKYVLLKIVISDSKIPNILNILWTSGLDKT